MWPDLIVFLVPVGNYILPTLWTKLLPDGVVVNGVKNRSFLIYVVNTWGGYKSNTNVIV